MRKFLIPLLLATALTPAAAQARHDRPDGNSEKRSERAEHSNADRPARAERSDADRPAHAERNFNADRAARSEGAQDVKQSVNVDRPNRAERAQRAEHPARPDRVRPVDQDVQPVQQAEPSQPARSSATGQGRPEGLADAFRQIGRSPQADKDHDGDHDGDHHWNHDWRHDHRYDWWGYRNHYRSLFRLGSYYDPYGWGYRRWSIGFSLWPSYYGSNYWLNDPAMYRLPPAYGPYRWVRYYDDALLVDLYTGQVVDVIYNFFW